MVLIFILFVGGGYLIGKLIASFIPDEKKETITFINHTYETHNHLHIDKDTIKSLTDKTQSSHHYQSQD
jgi:hypothetical protein